MPIVAAYGAWCSPISPGMVAGGGVPLMTCRPAGGGVCWLEGRPLEGGRMVLVRRAPDGRVHDVTPPGFNVRTRVHEYGGVSFAIRGEGVFFSHFDRPRPERAALVGGRPPPVRPRTAPARAPPRPGL